VSNGHPIATSHINATTDGDDTSCDIKFDVPTDSKKTKTKNDKKKRSANVPQKKVIDTVEKVKINLTNQPQFWLALFPESLYMFILH